MGQMVSAGYEARIDGLGCALAKLRRQGFIAFVFIGVSAILLLLVLVSAAGHGVSFWWALPLLSLLIAALRRSSKLNARGSKFLRLMHFYEAGLRRLRGRWQGHGQSGQEFCEPEHVYAQDLNVLGEGSMFELLCVARTGIGRRGLAKLLMSPADVGAATERQAAIAELSCRRDLTEKIAVLGDYDFQDSRWATFIGWLGTPPAWFPQWLPPLFTISGAALAVMLLGAWNQTFDWETVWPPVFSLLVINGACYLHFHSRTEAIEDAAAALAGELEAFQEGVELISAEVFLSDKIVAIQTELSEAKTKVLSLRRWTRALSECNKDWFYLPSRILLVKTICAMKIEQWRRANGGDLKLWLRAWAEFEALHCLANYAYENPEHTFPRFTRGEPCFAAEGLGHPLLDSAVCVRNQVYLDRNSRFWIVSGSNMSGKSTLLRAIGLNAVLAFAGAPVRANKLTISELSICASMGAVDSLLEGKSKFLAEVTRIRQGIELAQQPGEVLFLIDEILSGTNSRDRRAAAEAVVRTFLQNDAIGVISTHDLCLTEIAEMPELLGENVHMGSKEGGGPLDFDYLVKPGPNRETNALAIARMAGVPV